MSKLGAQMQLIFGYVIAFSILAGGAGIARADDVFCQQLGELAKRVMHNRQVGVDMSDMMKIANDGKATGPVLRDLVLMAYDSPQYSTDEMQAAAVQEFANKVELNCYKVQK
ncbi:MAG: hypothetical protein KGI75_06815 [Rhizobiaceae bacterium]|nr:hypothetical protein [Rhizobiaceae bacterium]